jgi:hypothetical protein
MDLPNIDYILEGDFEISNTETEAKLNSSGEKLDLVCSLIDNSFDSITVEFDSDSSSIKFISESENHIMDVKFSLSEIIYILSLS